MTSDPSANGFKLTGKEVDGDVVEKLTGESPIPTFVIDRDHKVTHWSRAIQLLTGIKSDDIIGTRDHWKVFYPDYSPTMADLVVDGYSSDYIAEKYHGKSRQSRLMNDTIEAEDFFPHMGENGRWLLFHAMSIKNDNGEITGAIETMQDITEQKRLQENIRFYGQLILKAQEDERKRIARELHDDASTSMLLLLQRMDAVETEYLGTLTEPLQQEFENLRDQAVVILEELRHCAQRLRPRILDDLGLVAAIEWIVDGLIRYQDIDADVVISGEEYPLPGETKLYIFRIVQEALNNIRRHSKATRVDIELRFDETETMVSITDNGCGFELPDRIENLASGGHLGIMGISERAQLMQGTLNIRSKPGQGTKVTVTVPRQTDSTD